MAEKVRICSVDDVAEGFPYAVNPAGFPALVVFRIANEIFVTGNLCTHGHALLSEGFQEGEVIECPLHGGAFDIRSGEPVALPCSERIPTYEAITENGEIFINASQRSGL